MFFSVFVSNNFKTVNGIFAFRIYLLEICESPESHLQFI